jgi:dTDP-4-dehydrorhamnose 3,5-epimerase
MINQNNMIEGVVIKPIEKFKDNRGWLAEMFRVDETDFKPAMGYISETNPGIVRGPHEHKEQSDFFVFAYGEFKLYLWDNREGAENYRKLFTFDVGGENACSVIIPPGVVHGYKCISETPGITVNLPNALYKGEGKTEEIDEIRWEADPNSPFVIE